MVVFPKIAAGWAGVVREVVTFSETGALAPQILLAVTFTLPLFELGVTLIELLVELPDQPEGNVQVYELAPGTTEML